MLEFLRIQIPTDRTSLTRTRATQMLTYKFVELCSTPLTTAPRQPNNLNNKLNDHHTVLVYIYVDLY